jgi:hypothetical protein
LVQEGFLGHEPCGRLRSSLRLVISSIEFWQDSIDSLSYPVLLRVLTLCLIRVTPSCPI